MRGPFGSAVKCRLAGQLITVCSAVQLQEDDAYVFSSLCVLALEGHEAARSS
jgi:hypothetical protein